MSTRHDGTAGRLARAGGLLSSVPCKRELRTHGCDELSALGLVKPVPTPSGIVPTMAQPFFLDDLNPPEPVAPYGFPGREAVRARLAGMAQELHERGVLAMSLFGSVARGEASDESDIDIVIDTREGFDLFDLASLTCLLEERMGTKVDIINRHSIECQRFAGRSLPKTMLQCILRNSIPVY